MQLLILTLEEMMEAGAILATAATAIMGGWTCQGKHVSWTRSSNGDKSVYCAYDDGMEWDEGVDGSLVAYVFALDKETLQSIVNASVEKENTNKWLKTPYVGYGNSKPVEDEKAAPIIKGKKYVETGKPYWVYDRTKNEWIAVPEILYKDPVTGKPEKGVILTGQPCDEYNKIDGKQVEKGKEYLIPIVNLCVDKENGRFEFAFGVGPLNRNGGKGFDSIEETDLYRDVKRKLQKSLKPSRVTREMIEKLEALYQEETIKIPLSKIDSREK